MYRCFSGPPTYRDKFPESVYNLRPAVCEEYVASPRYVSTYAEKVVRDHKAPKRPTKTFGLPEIPRETPSHFLKKASKLKPTCLMPVRKPNPAFPKVDARRTIQNHPLSRDMIGRTKRAVLSIKPKDPIHLFVDDRHGDKYPFENSGLVQNYTLRPNYGRIPKYVEHFKRMKFAKEQSIYEAAQGAELLATEAKYVPVNHEERERVLTHLRENFAEALHRFQGLSFSLDNESKRRTKRILEKTLNELEKTIELIARRKKIVISMEQFR